MEQEKQYQADNQKGHQLKKERQAETKKNNTKQLHITFHNPNSIEDTAKYLSKIIVNNLAELEKIKNTKDG